MNKLFVFMFSFFFLTLTLFASSVSDLNLTKKEKNFIAQKKVIHYVYDNEWAPFEWKNGINVHVGMVADILKIIADKSGLKFEATSANSWVASMKMLESGEVEMASGLTQNSSRSQYSNFTKNTLFSIPYVFVSRNGESCANGFKGLNKSKLAYVKGYAIEEYLEVEHPNVVIQTVSNITEGFLKLLDKKIDILLINQASAQYEIELNGYKQLNISYKTKYTLPIRVAINKNFSQEALSIIDKTIASISKDEIHIIYDKYMYIHTNKLQVSLTNKEKLWIKNHQLIRFVGDPSWLPFEAFNADGQYVGIVAEYLQKIEEVTGLKFEVVQTNTWEDSIAFIKNNKADVISETVDSNMSLFLSFSDAYLQSHIVIVMNKKSRYFDNISLIKDKKIVLIKGYGYTTKIKKSYPKIQFIEVENIHKALDLVSSGEVDAFLSTMALSSFHISKGAYVNLRIVGKTEFSTKLGYGVRNEMKPLVGILNKAIAVLENGTKQEILRKWTVQKYIEKVDYTLVWQILAVSVFLLSLFFYWTRRMKSEIERRVKAEEEQEKMLVQQAKMAAMGEMIDAIAHQWKQPLNAISMLSELAQMDFEEKLVDKKYMLEYKKQVDTQIFHLISTLDEFRDFFRPSKEVSLFDVKTALESLLLLVKDEFLNNTIEIKIVEDEKLSLKGIENEFKHIVLNIINNSKDAFNENNISERKITLRLYVKESVKCIEIRDNAGGIPSSIIQDIFKANVTSKAEGKGTGIGLYMSDQIAQKMTAKLSVRNVESGAAFLLEI